VSIMSKHRFFLFLMLSIVGASMAIASERIIKVEINKGEMVKLDRAASSVVVADPTTADVQVVSPKLLFVHGKKVGETSVFAVDSDDEPILNATVEVTHNLSSLNRNLKRIAPDSDVQFKTIDGGLVMDGFTSSIAESDNIRNLASAYIGSNEKMVNMLTSAGSDQVMLQVKIVEMTRDSVKRFGINMQNAFQIGNLDLQVLQGAEIIFDQDTKLGPENKWETGGRTGVLDRLGGQSTQIAGRYRNGRVNNVIDALETEGLATTLAEPSLTTTSGKPASFLAGGEFPVAVKGGDGQVSVEYKPFGVSLKFTPVVLSKERLSIDVSPEVSSISFNNPIEVAGIRNPIINTRKAQSTIELSSGSTFALAGLLQNDSSNSITKFPGLGDVPVLGGLFRSTSFQNNQSELVILVTPYIVRPIQARSKIKLPTDGYVPASDFQRLLLGNLYQQEPMDNMENKEKLPALNGTGGFILDEQE